MTRIIYSDCDIRLRFAEDSIAHFLHPFPLIILSAIGLHIFPHTLHLTLTLEVIQSYFPIISILGLIPLILFSNSFWVKIRSRIAFFCLQFEQPFPNNKLSPVGFHNFPHNLHFTKTGVLVFTYFPKILMSLFFEYTTLSKLSCVYRLCPEQFGHFLPCNKLLGLGVHSPSFHG